MGSLPSVRIQVILVLGLVAPAIAQPAPESEPVPAPPSRGPAPLAPVPPTPATTGPAPLAPVPPTPATTGPAPESSMSEPPVAPPAKLAPPEPVITIGGYVETYYQLNFRRPSNQISNLRAFDNRERTFTLSNVAIDAKGEHGPLTARVVLQAGSTPSTIYLAEPTHPGTSSVNPSTGELWKYVQLATIAYTTPDKVVVDAGLFPSPIGAEVVPIKDNWNWSRSDLFFGLPAYHTGVRVAAPLGGGWTGMVHVYNGWNSVVDNNPYPSVGVSAGYASTTVTAQVLYFGGIERPAGGPEGKPWRNLLDAYATIAINDKVERDRSCGRRSRAERPRTQRLGRRRALRQGAARAHAVRGGAWRLLPRVGRQRRRHQRSCVAFPTPWIGSATATLAYQPADGLSIRLELRHDQAKTPVFFGDDVAGDGVTTAVRAQPASPGHPHARGHRVVLMSTISPRLDGKPRPSRSWRPRWSLMSTIPRRLNGIMAKP